MKLFSQRTCNAGKKFFSPLLFVRFTSLSMSVSLVLVLSLSISFFLSNSTSMYLSTSFSTTVSPPVSFKMQKKTVQANKEMSKSIEFGHTTFHPILSKWIPPLCQFSFGTHFLAILLISFKSVYEQQIRKVNCFPICLFFKFFAKHFPCRLPVQYGAYSFFFADPKHFFHRL